MYISTVIKKKFVRYCSTTNEPNSIEDDFLTFVQATDVNLITKNIPIFVEIVQDQNLTDINKTILRLLFLQNKKK